MHEQTLPKEYKGFSTAELLELWDGIPDNTLYDPPSPKGMISAMDDLLREYELLDWDNGKGDNDAAKIRRSKKLMAPFGIDPVPWADEEGIWQEELSEASAERDRQRSKAVRARYKAQEREFGPFWKLPVPEDE